MITMNRIFFIDFENVGLSGLAGIENLDSTDIVLIFSGVKSPKLSLEEADRIYNSAVKVNIVMNSQPRKNALDFIISAYLGYALGKDTYQEHIIISKDKGYLPAIEAMREFSGKAIRQEKDILSAINAPQAVEIQIPLAAPALEENQTDVRMEVATQEEGQLPGVIDEEEVVSQAIHLSSSKVEFHNMLQSILRDAPKATALYNRVKNKINWDSARNSRDGSGVAE